MFIHLHVHSPYSFLDGASSIECYLKKAASFAMPAMALTDHHCLSGAVEFHEKARQYGIQPIQGAEITTEDGFHLTLLAEDHSGYQNLCRLVTASFAHKDNRKHPQVPWEALRRYHKGLLVLSGCRRSAVCQALLRQEYQAAEQALQTLIAAFGQHQVFLEMINTYLPRTNTLLRGLYQLSQQMNIPVVATNNVHYADKETFPIHDLFVCTRTLSTLESIHPDRPLNGENYFASPAEMKERFRDFPQAIDTTQEIAERCQRALLFDRNVFPSFPLPKSHPTASSFLEFLVWQGAEKRYGQLTEDVRQRLQHELGIIHQLNVADYFLVVWDIVQHSRKEGIRYAGRGSAADSAVAYCLGITNVDAIERGLLFERFLSLERAQKPDIDIDFDAKKRDDVAQYVYEKYGADHVASVCTFASYHARSALRDIGRAFGYSAQELKGLTRGIPHYTPCDGIEAALAAIPELKHHPLRQEKYAHMVQLCKKMTAFPRQIGTHLGGLVVSGPPLVSVTPLQVSAKGVRITQFDKDTIEPLGLIKLDLLSLRTLSAVQEVEPHLATQGQCYDTIPLDDRATYDMLNKGDSVGVFQLESPAQRSLQSRLKADSIEDIVASVALIRPGPIKGNMVEPFLARRRGLETPTYIHPKLEPILKKTFGVVLYQEQVIEIATAIAGFTPGESDRLRRVMSHQRSHEEMEAIGKEFVARAVTNGVEKEVADTIFSYIVGYAGYGFCEAHAAAFSDTAYKTAYLLRHYPANFYAALLNNQPMGFYPPNTLCVQARQKGVTILPLDIEQSDAAFTADEDTIRIGLQQVKGMEESFLESILQARKEQSFRSFSDFIFRTQISRDVIENLILAGAFDRFDKNRRGLLWSVPAHLRNRQGSLFVCEDTEKPAGIADFSPWQRWLHEYSVLYLSAKTHIMDFFRADLRSKHAMTSRDVAKQEKGMIKAAGVVIRPHRPPTRSGRTVVFLTLEDEYGLLDVTIFENVYRRYAEVIYGSPLLLVEGEISRRNGQEPSIIAHKVQALAKPR